MFLGSMSSLSEGTGTNTCPPPEGHSETSWTGHSEAMFSQKFSNSLVEVNQAILDSGDDSDDSDDSGDDSIDTEEIDAYCATLTANSCSAATDDDGYHLCAVNLNTGSCYGIVASDGIYGKGNFDTGYTAAQAAADQETQQLNTIVGVLGGIVGLLVILAAAGGYYFYTKQKETAADAAMPDEVMSMEHDDTVTGTAGMEDGTALMDDEE